MGAAFSSSPTHGSMKTACRMSMKNMKNMLNKMGIPGMGNKNAKMNMGAMTGKLKQNVKICIFMYKSQKLYFL